MIILSDIDGCILDFYKDFSNFVLNKTNRFTEENLQNCFIGNCTQKVKEIFNGFVNDFCKTEEISNLDFFRDSLETILKLKSDLYLLTALPEEFKSKRIKNLEPIKSKIKEIIFDENKISILLDLKPDIVIEDHPDYIKEYLENGFKVYAPRTDYNKKITKCNYFDSWKELYKAGIIV